LATLGIASSPGVPQALAALTLNAPYNDLEAVERIFGQHRAGIAAVIVEPVAANMGVVPPAAGFLRGLREITERNGALLIFDEVISGFRLCYGGAQTLYGITPDLTTLGKIVGGGLPLAAYGGRRDLMQRLAPEGPVYQAGTLSGNPVAVRAGLVTLEKLSAPGFYDALNRKAARLADGISSAIADAGVVAQVVRVGSLLTIFFGASAMRNYADVKRCDTVKFGAFFRALLERGILLPPSQFEALFVSAAHSDDDIAQTIATMKDALLAA
jgi:glutamate-1-semialdehyde 2,1-aminomutase